MSTFAWPFRSTYHTLQRYAHESPVYFYATVVGLAGPVTLLVVPPVRKRLGYVHAEDPPKSYPVPNRARRPTQGFEDEDS